jgi:hypothetical protein
MTDEPQDPFTMTHAEATAALDTMAQAFREPPAPATATTAAEAASRLRQLTENPKWREGYLNGSAAVRREFSELTALVASGDQTTPDLSIETVDAVSDPNALPKAGYAALIDGLREGGLPDEAEAYIRDIDSGRRTDRPTAGDGVACKQALDRLSRDPGVRNRYLTRELLEANIVNALNRVIAYAADDGQPVTEAVAQRLSALGLR